jgi:hypothetical protein
MAKRDRHHPPEKEADTWPSEAWPVNGHTSRNIICTFKFCHLAQIRDPAARRRMLASNRE